MGGAGGLMLTPVLPPPLPPAPSPLPPGGWACAACTSVNGAGVLVCAVCDTPAPAAVVPGQWTCKACTFAENPADAFKCGCCDSAKS